MIMQPHVEKLDPKSRRKELPPQTTRRPISLGA